MPKNNLEIPDYNAIEIKTSRTYSKSYIPLFNDVPDDQKKRKIERLKNVYGYPYKNDKRYKVLYADSYGNKKSLDNQDFNF